MVVLAEEAAAVPLEEAGQAEAEAVEVLEVLEEAEVPLEEAHWEVEAAGLLEEDLEAAPLAGLEAEDSEVLYLFLQAEEDLDAEIAALEDVAVLL